MKIFVAILCLSVYLSIFEAKTVKKRFEKEEDLVCYPISQGTKMHKNEKTGGYHRGLKFKKYMKKFRPRFYYNADELERREKNVNENSDRIERHNNKKDARYRQAINEWSDMHPENFTKKLCGDRPPTPYQYRSLPADDYDYSSYSYTIPKYPEGPIPENCDYSYVMQPVQNQGGCGSCWSFAAAATLEAQLKLRKPTFNSQLSRQQIIDCLKSSSKCDGGSPISVFQWLMREKIKLGTHSEYPYTLEHWVAGQVYPQCKASQLKNTIETDVVDVVAYPINDEDALARYVYFYGPVAISMKVVSNAKFQNYRDGIFFDSQCPTGPNQCSDTNHALTVVGYGVENKKAYWIVLNSWGLTWGEGGYGKMAKGQGNNCNVACLMQFPVIKF